MSKPLLSISICVMLCLSVTVIPAASLLRGSVKSASYEFEYVQASAGGGGFKSADYAMETMIVSEGLESVSSSSTDYTISPLIDSPNSGTSFIDEWMLY